MDYENFLAMVNSGADDDLIRAVLDMQFDPDYMGVCALLLARRPRAFARFAKVLELLRKERRYIRQHAGSTPLAEVLADAGEATAQLIEAMRPPAVSDTGQYELGFEC